MLPSLFGLSLSILYTYSKLIVAMADSKLLPSFLSKRTRSNVPLYALLAGQVPCILFVVYGYLDVKDVSQWSNMIAACAFLTYSVQMIGFLCMKVKLGEFQRPFVSPFGAFGGIVALLVFSIGLITVIVFHYQALPIIFVYLALVSFYYYYYARHHQIFSDAERKVVVPAHAEIRNANGKRPICCRVCLIT
jgi:amino acid transporter